MPAHGVRMLALNNGSCDTSGQREPLKPASAERQRQQLLDPLLSSGECRGGAGWRPPARITNPPGTVSSAVMALVGAGVQGSGALLGTLHQQPDAMGHQRGAVAMGASSLWESHAKVGLRF